MGVQYVQYGVNSSAESEFDKRLRKIGEACNALIAVRKDVPVVYKFQGMPACTEYM